AGLMECFGSVVSVSLQHGVPLRVLCDKLSHTRFEPSGWTGNERIGYAKSIMDYIFRWIEARFLTGDQLPLLDVPLGGKTNAKDNLASLAAPPKGFEETYGQGYAPRCVTCGALMVPMAVASSA